MLASTVLYTIMLTMLLMSFCHGEISLHPLSDEFIDSINKKQSIWKAGRNFPNNPSISALQYLAGAMRSKDDGQILPLKTHSKLKEIPETFDAREEWSKCANIIGEIFDQSSCGSCWALAAAEVMSDRICIHSNATLKVKVSSEDLLTCCYKCSYGFGCTGGSTDEAFAYWNSTGIVTGGAYQSGEGCKSYSFPPCEHHIDGELPACGPYEDAPKCDKTCDEESNLTYHEDLTTGSAYSLRGEKDIQLEILENGPVVATYNVYEDFFSYKSGVYESVRGDFVGGHAVKIIGWGVVEDGTKYWLVANSWNSHWGDNGFFKILRGSNECNIENEINAGIPNIHYNK